MDIMEKTSFEYRYGITLYFDGENGKLADIRAREEGFENPEDYFEKLIAEKLEILKKNWNY